MPSSGIQASALVAMKRQFLVITTGKSQKCEAKQSSLPHSDVHCCKSHLVVCELGIKPTNDSSNIRVKLGRVKTLSVNIFRMFVDSKMFNIDIFKLKGYSSLSNWNWVKKKREFHDTGEPMYTFRSKPISDKYFAVAKAEVKIDSAGTSIPIERNFFVYWSRDFVELLVKK